MRKTKLVLANWKLNPATIREARELFQPLKKIARGLKKTEVIVFPPAIFLGELKEEAKLSLGAQDIFWENAGAYTGKLGPTIYKYAGATYVLVGHSESRALGDDNEKVNLKLRAGLKSGLKVVLCVGEKERDLHGEYLNELKSQLKEALVRVGKKDFTRLIIAYEPVWAIGRQATTADTPSEFLHNALFIKKILAQLVSKEIAFNIPILYGGSVDSKNATSFLIEGQADGLLIGRASLNTKQFSEIIKQAEAVRVQ